MEIKKPTLEMVEENVNNSQAVLTEGISAALSLLNTVVKSTKELSQMHEDARVPLLMDAERAISVIQKATKDMIVHGYNVCMLQMLKSGRVKIEDVAQIRVDSIKEH